MIRLHLLVRGAALGTLALAAVALASCGDDDNKATATATKAAASASAAGSAASGAAGQTATVKIADFSFTPSVKVAKGGKVTWDWAGSNAPHSVMGVSDNAKTLLKSDRNSGGKGTYEVVFKDAGTYKYQCGVHGESMSAEVVVQ